MPRLADRAEAYRWKPGVRESIRNYNLQDIGI